MKKIVFVMSFFMGALLLSCGNNKSNAAKTDDGIVTTVVKDNQGNALNLAFDNTKGTATVEFKGESISMVQDTVASGVKMHNDNYTYEEWKGHVVLKKDGQVVFDNEQ